MLAGFMKDDEVVSTKSAVCDGGRGQPALFDSEWPT